VQVLKNAHTYAYTYTQTAKLMMLTQSSTSWSLDWCLPLSETMHQVPPEYTIHMEILHPAGQGTGPDPYCVQLPGKVLPEYI